MPWSEAWSFSSPRATPPATCGWCWLTGNDLAHETAWSWARFLPHLADPASGEAAICIDESQTEHVLSGLARLISDREALLSRQPSHQTSTDRTPVTPAVVLVVDGTRPAAHAAPPSPPCCATAPPLASMPSVSTNVPNCLPAQCAAVVELGTGADRPLAAVVRQDGAANIAGVVVDQVDREICETAARALAPLVYRRRGRQRNPAHLGPSARAVPASTRPNPRRSVRCGVTTAAP